MEENVVEGLLTDLLAAIWDLGVSCPQHWQGAPQPGVPHSTGWLGTLDWPDLGRNTLVMGTMGSILHSH